MGDQQDISFPRKEEGLTLEGMPYSLILGGGRVDADLRSFLTQHWRVNPEGCFALAAICDAHRGQIRGSTS